MKDVGREVLLKTIHAVHLGQSPVSPKIGAKLAGRIVYGEQSEREEAVLHLMVRGMSNREIAASLFITESTVKFHVTHVLGKLNAENRTQAVITALKRGLASLQ